MKPCKPLILALGACLLAAMAFAVKVQAQATENANFEAGIAAYQANDLPLAYKEFLAAAKEGHADSQFNVALMYEQGIGVGKDEQEAVVWYGKAASQGKCGRAIQSGVLYENGRGTKVDFAKANEWYRKASLQGDALAIGNLGMLYMRGQGAKENKIVGRGAAHAVCCPGSFAGKPCKTESGRHSRPNSSRRSSQPKHSPKN